MYGSVGGGKGVRFFHKFLKDFKNKEDKQYFLLRSCEKSFPLSPLSFLNGRFGNT